MMSSLVPFWYIIIAVLWTGFFVLEGFDFGVGMLLPVLGRDNTDRRVLLNAIGPTGDGNEVWLLVAGGATFAAFPSWYASLFSGFYLALLLVLVALIVRVVALEFRSKIDSDRWRRTWDRVIVFGSAVPALLWGVAFGNIVHGVPLNAQHVFTGSFLTLLTPYALLGGLTTLAVFLFHGAVFLGLKTTGGLRTRAMTLSLRLGMVAVVLGAVFLAWTQFSFGHGWTWLTALLAAALLVGAVLAARAGREGRAFLLAAGTIVLFTATLFTALYPNVLPSTTAIANSLTVTNASSSPYTLTVMTWVAVVFTPIVLAYQAWTYWVFRQRISRTDLSAPIGLPPLLRARPAGGGR